MVCITHQIVKSSSIPNDGSYMNILRNSTTCMLFSIYRKSGKIYYEPNYVEVETSKQLIDTSSRWSLSLVRNCGIPSSTFVILILDKLTDPFYSNFNRILVYGDPWKRLLVCNANLLPLPNFSLWSRFQISNLWKLKVVDFVSLLPGYLCFSCLWRSLFCLSSIPKHLSLYLAVRYSSALGCSWWHHIRKNGDAKLLWNIRRKRDSCFPSNK